MKELCYPGQPGTPFVALSRFSGYIMLAPVRICYMFIALYNNHPVQTPSSHATLKGSLFYPHPVLSAVMFSVSLAPDLSPNVKDQTMDCRELSYKTVPQWSPAQAWKGRRVKRKQRTVDRPDV